MVNLPETQMTEECVKKSYFIRQPLLFLFIFGFTLWKLFFYIKIFYIPLCKWWFNMWCHAILLSVPMECQPSDSKKLTKVFDASKRSKSRKKGRHCVDHSNSVASDGSTSVSHSEFIYHSRKGS